VFYYLIALVESDIVCLVLLVVFCSLFLLSFILVVYVFPLTAYFENTVINTIRNAIGMGMGHLRQSIPACALCILPILAMVVFPNLFLRLLFLILMLVPGAVAYGIAGLLLPLFEKYSISAEDVE